MLLYLIVIILLANCQSTAAACRRLSPSPHVIVTYPKGESGRRVIKEDTMLMLSCEKGYEPRSGDSFITCLKNKWSVIESDHVRPSTPFHCLKKPCPFAKPKNGTAVLEKNTVRYSCDFGFTLKGPKVAVCRLNSNGDYVISTRPPKCLERPQCKKRNIANLIYRKDCCLNGSLYTFSCEKDFRLVGENYLKCGKDGLWKGILPYCQAIQKCRHPGNAAFSKRQGKCCTEGSVIEYSCNKGYELLNRRAGNKIKCLENAEWDKPRPICKPKGIPYCESPTPEHNLIVESDKRQHPEIFLPNDLIDFACPKYYKSNHKSFSLLCLDDGFWDSDLPVCFPSNPCTMPRIPKNGKILEAVNVNNDTIFAIGSEINFECDHGFHIENGIYFTTCIGNEWEHQIPDCVPITCADPGIPKHGNRIGNDFTFGREIHFNCMGGMQLLGSPIRVCMDNGRWSGVTTVCDAGGSHCPNPGIPVNSNKKGEKYNLHDIVTYSCKLNNQMIGNFTRQCLENRAWSGKEIQCYGKNEYSDYDEVATSLDKAMTVVARSAMGTPLTTEYLRSSNAMPITVDGGVNLIFLLDVSNSISELHFNQSKAFIKMVIRKVGISSQADGVRAAVVSFSSDAKDIFATNIADIQVALNAIESIEYDRKGTNIYKAYERAGSLITVGRQGERKNSKSYVFLISDGMITEGGPPIDLALNLQRRYDTTIYAIAVGREKDLKTLTAISNELYMFENHLKLLEIVEKAIGTQIDFSPCGLERPGYNLDSGVKVNPNANRRSSAATVKITGGRRVEGAWPWMAAFKLKPLPRYKVQVSDEVSCGGVIIHKLWILSAAHCFNSANEDEQKLRSDTRNWKVVVGRTDASLGSALPCSVRSIISHPLYHIPTTDYDIALVQLMDPLIYDIFIRPICLPPLYDDLENEKTLYAPKQLATVIGWGHDVAKSVNVTKGKSVDYLNEADLPLQTPEICQKSVSYMKCEKKVCRHQERQPTDTMFCAGSGYEGIDACQGDSGGPLMQEVMSEGRSGNLTRWFSIGIVSWGVGCGQDGFYGYYTHVAKLREWINNTTQVEFEDLTIKTSN